MAEPRLSDWSGGRPQARPEVLLVDDDAASLRVATVAVATAGGEVTAAIGARDLPAAPGRRAPAYAIVDLPNRDALDVVDALAASGVIVIATSGAGSVSLAVEAMRRGAIDFVLKPYTPDGFARRLALRFAERKEPQPAAARMEAAHGFVGQSPAMRELYGQIDRIAPSRAPVFILGESGVGKELCAEAIHARSGRADKPFVALNCGAIPRELMESEVFGHVRGAFTGASEDRIGAAEAASGGTLFLDEIGEMEMALQAKLLRVLQTGEFRRVGEARARRADIRIVCATHRDPHAEIAAGRFRQDLFYRLHVLPIRLPPLRERGDDVALLAETFLARFSAEEDRSFTGFAPEALDLIRAYAWPGNVRELQNVVRRAVVLDDGDVVTAEMLPAEVRAATPPRPAAAAPMADAPIEPFHVTERRIIERAIDLCGGNLAKAAAALELSPSTIYRKRERWAAGDSSPV